MCNKYKLNKYNETNNYKLRKKYKQIMIVLQQT